MKLNDFKDKNINFQRKFEKSFKKLKKFEI